MCVACVLPILRGCASPMACPAVEKNLAAISGGQIFRRLVEHPRILQARPVFPMSIFCPRRRISAPSARFPPVQTRGVTKSFLDRCKYSRFLQLHPPSPEGMLIALWHMHQNIQCCAFLLVCLVNACCVLTNYQCVYHSVR